MSTRSYAVICFKMPVTKTFIMKVDIDTFCDLRSLLCVFQKNKIKYFSILKFCDNDDQFQKSPHC